MVARVARVGERVAHKIERDRYDGNDDGGEQQRVGRPGEDRPRGGKQHPQRRRHDVHQAQVGQRGFIGDGARDRQRQAQDDDGDQIGEDVPEQNRLSLIRQKHTFSHLYSKYPTDYV